MVKLQPIGPTPPIVEAKASAVAKTADAIPFDLCDAGAAGHAKSLRRLRTN